LRKSDVVDDQHCYSASGYNADDLRSKQIFEIKTVCFLQRSKSEIIDLNIAWLETKHDDITINFPILNPHPVVNDNSSNMIYNPESRELARPHSAAEVRANKKSNDMTVHSG
jgi:hypothetical protein